MSVEEKEDYENTLKLSKITLLFSGIKIYDIKCNKFFKYIFEKLFFFNMIWLYTDVFGEIYWLIEGVQMGKSFIELSIIAPCITIALLATSKSASLYFKRDIVVSVIDKLREIHPVDDHIKSEYGKAEIGIVKESVKFLNLIIMLLYYVCAVVVVVFSLLPVMAMGYDYYTTGDMEIRYPFPIKYFFDPFTKERWVFVYFHQVMATGIVAANVFGTDTLFYALCTYIYMHFRILCHRFENAVAGSEETTRTWLRHSLQRHQELIHLVDQIEALYTQSTLFNIVSSSVLICLSAFNITFQDDNGAVFAFMTFLGMNLSQISLLCFFGDMLMVSSMKVSEAIYRCRWYEADESVKKCILLVLIRTQKPCKLTAANFADLKLTAFTTILSRSWSYFALLKTMYK